MSLTDLASKVAQHTFQVQRFAGYRALLFDNRSGELKTNLRAPAKRASADSCLAEGLGRNIVNLR
jgi:hypothetical protein